MQKIRVGVHGAAGRMGQRLIALIQADSAQTDSANADGARPDSVLELTAAIDVKPCENISIPQTFRLEELVADSVDILIDFSSPHCSDALFNYCTRVNLPFVFATTGLSPEQLERLRESARSVPVLWSPSMSMTVNLAMQLCGTAAQTLHRLSTDTQYADVEIIEKHHRFKVDSPSGTALKFGELISDRMGLSLPKHGRHGGGAIDECGERTRHEIGYHAVRIGDNPGEHTVLFGLLGETLEITVKASNRDCYALGALAAARFLFGKPPGLYGMPDVLGGV